MREAILTSDPKNRTARLVLIRAPASGARVGHAAGQRQRVRAYLARANQVAVEDATLATDRQYERDLAIILTLEARLAHQAGDRRRACSFHTRARAMADQAYPEADWGVAARAWVAATATSIGPCGR